MDAIVIALIGVVGTLAGVIVGAGLTWFQQRRSEQRAERLSALSQLTLFDHAVMSGDSTFEDVALNAGQLAVAFERLRAFKVHVDSETVERMTKAAAAYKTRSTPELCIPLLMKQELLDSSHEQILEYYARCQEQVVEQLVPDPKKSTEAKVPPWNLEAIGDPETWIDPNRLPRKWWKFWLWTVMARHAVALEKEPFGAVMDRIEWRKPKSTNR